MKLEQWIKEQIESKSATGKKDAYKRLAATIREAGGETVSVLTIENVAGGLRIKKYDKAKAIELATGGAVTIAELCE